MKLRDICDQNWLRERKSAWCNFSAILEIFDLTDLSLWCLGMNICTEWNMIMITDKINLDMGYN